MTTKGKDTIEYGDVSFPPEAFAPNAVRRRISIMVPEDVLAKLRERAGAAGIGYQTLANQILRDAVTKSEAPSSADILGRLSRVEGAMQFLIGDVALLKPAHEASCEYENRLREVRGLKIDSNSPIFKKTITVHVRNPKKRTKSKDVHR